MKNHFCLISTLLLFALKLGAQSPKNLTGDWIGMRQQHNDIKTAYKENFKYKYSLTQHEDKVIGVVYITKSDGSYAELAVKGYVADNIFYFEEYEILNAKRSNGFQWCRKAGILNIDSVGPNEFRLTGRTESIMEFYNTECTGGYTTLSRKYIHLGEGVMINEADIEEANLTNNIEIVPNPFVNHTNIKVSLPKASNLYIDVIDVTGNTIAVLEKGSHFQAGTHSFPFELNSPLNTPQFYYLRVKIGFRTYSRILQKQ